MMTKNQNNNPFQKNVDKMRGEQAEEEEEYEEDKEQIMKKTKGQQA